MLRPYQQRIADASIGWMRRRVDPFVIEAATGAGKSHIIADVAARIHAMTGKRVLCLAPSAELVVQNRDKFIATGAKASTFSASAGGKGLRWPVVFGSPITVRNQIHRFTAPGSDGYALVILDEAHGITPTVQAIIAAMRDANPVLRVMGLTATPYRLGAGYIYREEPDGSTHGEDRARDPYFTKCVARVGARELIDQGYLTPPVIGEIGAEGYETANLTLNSRGQFDAEEVDRAYHGHGRKTAAIVADIVARSQGRRGVILFAATVQHAREVLASLPPELSAIVTADTPRNERSAILERFKTQRVKYIVNVAVLTVGFDAPHVDVIAILRKTESVGLLQQIVGRGLRLCEGKTDCLVLDYTSNIEEHCPDGDLFDPIICANKAPGAPGSCKVHCPECEYENRFTLQPQVVEAGYEIDRYGYCLDLDGNQVMTDYGPMPAHFGRRCMGQVRIPETPGTGRQQYERCGYRWTGKDCPRCGERNDIAARYCYECRAELVDPNERLAAQFQALKRDPTQKQTDRVLKMETTPGVSQRGNPTLRVEFSTPYRAFTVWLQPAATHVRGQREYDLFMDATKDGAEPPQTVTYQKDPDSKFYRVLAYDRPEDAPPTITADGEVTGHQLGFFDATA